MAEAAGAPSSAAINVATKQAKDLEGLTVKAKQNAVQIKYKTTQQITQAKALVLQTTMKVAAATDDVKGSTVSNKPGIKYAIAAPAVICCRPERAEPPVPNSDTPDLDFDVQSQVSVADSTGSQRLLAAAELIRRKKRLAKQREETMELDVQEISKWYTLQCVRKSHF